MTEIVIDKKKYVLIPDKDYKQLQRKAALKSEPDRLLTVEQARNYSKKLIRKWADDVLSPAHQSDRTAHAHGSAYRSD